MSHGLSKPTFWFEWIGYKFDLAAGRYGVFVLPHHEAHLAEQGRALKRLPIGSRLKAVQIMRYAGKLASAHRVLGTCLRMFTFYLNQNAHSVAHKNMHVPWTVPQLREVEHWLLHFPKLNAAPIWPDVRYVACVYNARVRCDAGEPGWGLHMDNGEDPETSELPPDCEIAHGFWNRNEKKRSSTWRELKGFLLGFIALIVPRFAGQQVLASLDAMNVVTMWRAGGSRMEEHHAMLLELWHLCQEHGIGLTPMQWVPREQNVRADIVSKFFDTSDWQINKTLFRRIERAWGKPTVDLFATHLNCLVPRFFSRF